MEGLKVCIRYIFILSLVILCGIFLTDWFFTREGDLLNDTLVGDNDRCAHRLVRCVRIVLHDREDY